MFKVVVKVALVGSLVACAALGKAGYQGMEVNSKKAKISNSKLVPEKTAPEHILVDFKKPEAQDERANANQGSDDSLDFDIDRKAKALSTKAGKINPQAIKLGLKAYVKAQHKGLVKHELLTVVDFSKASSEKRLYVFDVKNEKLLFNELVAHGKNSGGRMATSFSNKGNSLKSSLGAFLTKNTYSGKHGYSLRVEGLEKGINHLAASRAVVMHSAKYVSNKIAHAKHSIGRSWGCFAVSPAVHKMLINTIKNGSVIFAYAPDKNYLSTSTFI